MSDTERVEIPRCVCSHSHVNHTRGTGKCWIAVCACDEYREPVKAAVQRHPAGKAIPQTADIQDYLRQKGEIA